MGEVIELFNNLKSVKVDTTTISARDLLSPEYSGINKFFKDKRLWTKEQKINFIESLFFGIFEQKLFIYEDRKKERFIIDGYNRIKTIKEFLNDDFVLEGLSQFHWQYNGKVYSRLKVFMQNQVAYYPFTINKITRINSEENLKHLYINLNT